MVDPKKYQAKSPRELKKLLTPLQYAVTQESGTEKPFENEFWESTAPVSYTHLRAHETF